MNHILTWNTFISSSFHNYSPIRKRKKLPSTNKSSLDANKANKPPVLPNKRPITPLNRTFNSSDEAYHWTDSKVPGGLTYLILISVSTLCYINSLPGDFVHDDLSVIVGNPDVTGGQSLKNIFTNDYWGKPMSDPLSHKSYRPLTVITFR